MTGESGRFYTPEEMADLMSLSVDALAKHRQRRQGPPWVRVGTAVRYPADAVRAWAMAEARRSLRQPGEVTTVTGGVL